MNTSRQQLNKTRRESGTAVDCRSSLCSCQSSSCGDSIEKCHEEIARARVVREVQSDLRRLVDWEQKGIVEEYRVTADIRYAFFQIQIPEEDRDFLRFLRSEGPKSIAPLKSSFWSHFKSIFACYYNPVSSRTAKVSSFYVNNYFLSLPFPREVLELIKNGDIMKQTHFELRDWTWNNLEILQCDPVPYPTSDKICIDVKSLARMGEDTAITRRNVLSACHRTSYPISFPCPMTIEIKKMIENTWKKKKKWDEPWTRTYRNYS
ncbi:hypothetical protein LAZ67_6003299 [Cordylochernes scorpioides]|uniref:Uncharacterized protein n=1 Tax=Cordylochernes scorpioides TaxID=51811 RepID=A0ABY6KL45_9ARAC|nr:hypothetical protein LAZ67_6003299 [Cordylochernes scorpioides]